MAIDLTNGATVSRFHSDGSGELLAAFQYGSDADSWAKWKVAKDSDNGMETTLVRANLYDGKMKMFQPPKHEEG